MSPQVVVDEHLDHIFVTEALKIPFLFFLIKLLKN
jgi:hypothetical protein